MILIYPLDFDKSKITDACAQEAYDEWNSSTINSKGINFREVLVVLKATVKFRNTFDKIELVVGGELINYKDYDNEDNRGNFIPENYRYYNMQLKRETDV